MIRGMDENTASAPGQPAAPRRVPAQVAAALRFAGPREPLVDDTMFHPGPDLGHWSVSFRLQLFTAPGLRPVAVVTQAVEDGPSLTNAAERYAAAVWERHCPDEAEPPLWVQRQLWGDRFGGHDQEKWELVAFTEAEPYQLRGPTWRTLSDGQLRELVGRPVDTGRGAGYTPRLPVPEPELHFDIWPVRRLPRPRPFREPACMPAGTTSWRRLLRQTLPTTLARPCCWYHGGDWHSVTRHAITALHRARRDGVPAEELEDYADRYAQTTGITPWQRQALASLFSLGDAIQPDEEGGYVNGQHRSQVLMDTGVRRTVVLLHRWPPPSTEPDSSAQRT